MKPRKVFSLSISYLKYRKLHTLLVVFIMMLTSLGYITINQTIQTYNQAKIINTYHSSGQYDFVISNLDDNIYRSLVADPRIALAGNEWVVGNTTTEIPLVLLYRDAKYQEITPSVIIAMDGDTPTEINHLAVARSFADYYSVSIGDEISLSFDKFDYSTGELLFTKTEKFTITGIIETAFFGDAGLGVALVSESYINSFPQPLIDTSAFITTNPLTDANELAQIIGDYELPPENVRMNNDLFIARNDAEAMGGFATAINIVILLIFGLIIYTLVYFEYLAKLKDFGIMRSLGISKNFISWVIVVQSFLYFVMAFIPAVIFSIAINNLIVDTIVKMLGISVNQIGLLSTHLFASIIIKAILLSLLTIIPSILLIIKKIYKLSPAQVVSQGKDYEVTRTAKTRRIRRVKSSKGSLIAFAKINMTRHKRRVFSTTLIIALSGLMIGVLVIINGTGGIDTEWLKEFIPGDIQLSSSNYAYENNAKGFSDSYISSIRANQYVQNIKAYSIQEIFFSMPETSLNLESDLVKQYGGSTFLRNKDEGMLINNCQLLAVEDIHSYSNASDGVVVDEQFAEAFNVSIGDTITLMPTTRTEVEFIISDIIEEIEIYNDITAPVKILIGMHDYSTVTETLSINRLDIWLSNALFEQEAMNEIVQLDNSNSIYMIRTFQSEVETFIEEQQRSERLTIILIAVVMVIALTVCFNTIMSSFSNREFETATLYVIGFSKKQIQKAYFHEGIMYALRGLSVAFITQLILVFSIGREFGSIPVFFLSLLAIDLILLGFCATVAHKRTKQLTQNINFRDA